MTQGVRPLRETTKLDVTELTDDELRAEIGTYEAVFSDVTYFSRYGVESENLRQAFRYRLNAALAELDGREWPRSL